MRRRKSFQKRTMESRVNLACARADESILSGVPLSINVLRKEIESVESLLPSVSLSIPYLEASFNNNEVHEKIARLNTSFESSRSFLGSIFGAVPQEHSSKVRALERQLKMLPTVTCEIVHFNSVVEAKSALEKLNSYLVRLKEGIPRAMARQEELLQAAIRREERREQRRIAEQQRADHQAGLAAAHLAAGRDRARSIIPRVRGVEEFCPYCEEELIDRQTHVDHIYPLSRGGLSTEVNMVEVCSTCNLYKSDLTLWEYVQQQGLDWLAVTQRLTALSKRF